MAVPAFKRALDIILLDFYKFFCCFQRTTFYSSSRLAKSELSGKVSPIPSALILASCQTNPNAQFEFPARNRWAQLASHSQQPNFLDLSCFGLQAFKKFKLNNFQLNLLIFTKRVRRRAVWRSWLDVKEVKRSRSRRPRWVNLDACVFVYNMLQILFRSLFLFKYAFRCRKKARIWMSPTWSSNRSRKSNRWAE